MDASYIGLILVLICIDTSCTKCIYTFSVKKALLNSINYKRRISKLLLSYLLGISLVNTKVKTLSLSRETL